jgi:protease-4
MPSFFKLVWAVMVGVLLLNLAVLGIVWAKWGQDPKIEKESLLFQTISGPILEYPIGGFTSGILATSDPTLHSILENLSKATRDDRITGVVLRLGHPGAGYAMLEEIRAELLRVREAGKTVWAWSDNFNMKDLYLASACDSFFVHPGSYVALHGMYGERFYLAGMMEKLGIEPEIHRIESYKSAAEMMTRSDMSPEAREMSEWIMNDIYPRIMWETAEGMGVDVGVLEGVMEKVIPMPDELEELGLVSGVRYWDEMKDALPRPDGKEEPRLLSASTYDGVSPEDVGQKGKKKIAVVHAQGIIGGSESGRDPFLGVMMGQQSVRRDLKKALDDDDVVGVVFRVDSQGGETLTSERIGRMVELVDKEKPVVISMVDVAASGGYTISYRGRTLLANTNTITGSIGSITGKMNVAGFYNKLGITFDGVGIGANADFYSGTRNWTFGASMSKVRSN